VGDNAREAGSVFLRTPPLEERRERGEDDTTSHEGESGQEVGQESNVRQYLHARAIAGPTASASAEQKAGLCYVIKSHKRSMRSALTTRFQSRAGNLPGDELRSLGHGQRGQLAR
jgi:hypothetical protein